MPPTPKQSASPATKPSAKRQKTAATAPDEPATSTSSTSSTAPAPTAAPVPSTVLKANQLKKLDEEGNCGNFLRAIEWSVVDQAGAKKNSKNGLIFQYINRSFDIEKKTKKGWVKMTDVEIDKYVTNSPKLANWSKYWEAWKIVNGDIHPDYSPVVRRQQGDDDTFGSGAIISNPKKTKDTTRGWFKIEGKAYFMETDDDASHFSLATNKTSPAVSLPCKQVTNASSVLANTQLDSNVIVHTVKVEWDSTVQDSLNKTMYGESKVTLDSVISRTNW